MKNYFAATKKSQKLGIFRHKKAPQYYGVIFDTSYLISVASFFYIIFLEKQQQAMLILKGNLFDAFAVVLVGNFTTQ
jgi:hypothetical protein